LNLKIKYFLTDNIQRTLKSELCVIGFSLTRLSVCLLRFMVEADVLRSAAAAADRSPGCNHSMPRSFLHVAASFSLLTVRGLLAVFHGVEALRRANTSQSFDHIGQTDGRLLIVFFQPFHAFPNVTQKGKQFPRQRGGFSRTHVLYLRSRSGRRYYILPMKFLSFYFFLSPQDLRDGSTDREPF